MARPKRTALTMPQRKAIEMLITSDVAGTTYADIAEQVGVTDKTLYVWRREPLFANELVKQAEDLQRAFLNDTYQTLRGLVTNSTVSDSNKLKAIEIMLKNQGRLKDVQESTVVVEEKSLDDILNDIQG